MAETLNNRIAVIHDPFKSSIPFVNGKTLTIGGTLNAPLGMTVAPNGHIITANGSDGFAGGHAGRAPNCEQAARQYRRAAPGVGTQFGVLFDPEVVLIFVDDGSNTLNALQ